MIYPGRPWLNFLRHVISFSKRWFGRLTIVLGFLYAVFQYEQAKIDNQVKQTLSFYDKFNSAPFTEYRSEVSSQLNSRSKQLEERANDNAKFSSYVIGFAEEPKFSKPFNMLLDFFDGVSICLRKELCDPDVVDDLFKPRAQEIYHVFAAYFDAVQKKNPVYASGLISVATHQSESGVKAVLRRLISSI
jgi:hypothetical protein